MGRQTTKGLPSLLEYGPNTKATGESPSFLCFPFPAEKHQQAKIRAWGEEWGRLRIGSKDWHPPTRGPAPTSNRLPERGSRVGAGGSQDLCQGLGRGLRLMQQKGGSSACQKRDEASPYRELSFQVAPTKRWAGPPSRPSVLLSCRLHPQAIHVSACAQDGGVSAGVGSSGPVSQTGCQKKPASQGSASPRASSAKSPKLSRHWFGHWENRRDFKAGGPSCSTHRLLTWDESLSLGNTSTCGEWKWSHLFHGLER